MHWLWTFCVVGVFVAFGASFDQAFFFPKSLVLIGISIFPLFFKILNLDSSSPPTFETWWILFFLFFGGVALWGALHPMNSILKMALFFAAFLLYGGIAQSSASHKDKLWKILVSVGVLESLLGLIQFFKVPVLPKILMTPEGHRVTGTFGNAEFLSQFLGVSLLIFWFKRKKLTEAWGGPAVVLAGFCLSLGLGLTETKGTFLFFFLLVLWKWTKNKGVVGGAVLMVFLFGFLYFPSSFKGRILLWMASVNVFKNHFLTGVGFGQMGNHYMLSVCELFEKFPILSDWLGGHAASVQDPHQILLGWGSELGGVGILLCVAFLRHCIRVGKNSSELWSYVIAFLIYKSFYTVVLGSVTGLVLWALVLALAKNNLNVYPGPPSKVFRWGGVLLLPLLMCGLSVSLSDYYLRKGMIFLNKNRVEEAELNFQKVLRLCPGHPEAELSLGYVNFLNQNIPGIMAHCERALRAKPCLDVYKKAAYIYYKKGQWGRALSLYKTLNIAYPDHFHPLLQMAEIYLQWGDFEQARELARKALGLSPRVPSSDIRMDRMRAQEILNLQFLQG